MSLDIYKKTPDGNCGDWHTVIWGSMSECLEVAQKHYPHFFGILRRKYEH